MFRLIALLNESLLISIIQIFILRKDILAKE